MVWVVILAMCSKYRPLTITTTRPFRLPQKERLPPFPLTPVCSSRSVQPQKVARAVGIGLRLPTDPWNAEFYTGFFLTRLDLDWKTTF